MIELTTSIAFLVTSIYGIGSTTPAMAGVSTTTATTTKDNSASIAAASTTDRDAVKAYLEQQYADTPILVAIAQCESNFRQFNPDGTVVRGKIDSHDIGVMQINETYWLPTSKSLGLDIYTIEGNTAYAKYLYAKSGTDPWKSSEKCWGDSEPLALKAAK
ncbi:MAG: hypothetical protein KGJ35_01425 [Patescibacteria group bacterium]|nr:hypothetical protein [Patescibacteria group bacterium]